MELHKVAFFIGSLGFGGAERIVSELSLNLPDNIEKHIILSRDKIDFPYKGHLHVLNIGQTGNIFNAINNFIIKWWKLRALKKKYNFTHAISFMEGSNIINILTRRKEKVIVSVRTFLSSSENKNFNHSLVRMFVRQLYNRADIIVATSNESKKDLLDNFGINEKNVRVIFNLCDVEKVNKLSKEKIYDSGKIFNNPVIINIGRLTNAKGHIYLLRIFKEVKKEISKCKLVIIGDGELRKFLFKYAESLKLITCWVGDNNISSDDCDVYYLGFQKNPFKYLVKSSLFAFTSIREGFPNALVEALACGIPVISSDCSSGPREILAPDTNPLFKTKQPEYARHGVLMPPQDSTTLSENDLNKEIIFQWKGVIVKLLRDSTVYNQYSRAGRVRAKDYSKEKIIREWTELIQS